MVAAEGIEKENERGRGWRALSSSVSWTMTSTSCFQVLCGNLGASLDPSRFGPGGRSRCIWFRGRWLTPTAFEDMAGKGSSHNWKRTIRTTEGHTLAVLIESNRLRVCNRLCSCSLCKPLLAANSERDSDSGVSSTGSTEQPLEYASMVQEALQALPSLADASLLNILLYVINRFDPPEEVSAIHSKLKRTLLFLHRMGIIERTGEGDEDLEEDERKVKVEVEQSKPVNSSIKSKNVPPTKPVEINPKTATTKPGRSKNTAKKQVVEMKPKKQKEYRDKQLTPAIAALCGGQSQMPRTEVVKRVWQYVRSHKLQDSRMRSAINCDAKMRAITGGKKQILQTELLGFIGKQLSVLPK